MAINPTPQKTAAEFDKEAVTKMASHYGTDRAAGRQKARAFVTGARWQFDRLQAELAAKDKTIEELRFFLDEHYAISCLREENQRLRKALEFYADSSSWQEDDFIQSHGVIQSDDIGGGVDGYNIFGGKRARQALLGPTQKETVAGSLKDVSGGKDEGR